MIDPIKATGELTFNVNTPNDMTVVNFKITSELGVSKVYTLNIEKMSNNNGFSVTVDDKAPEEDGDGNYSIVVGGSQEKAKVKVIKGEEEQIVEINNEVGIEKEVELNDVKTTVGIKVIAEDGTETTKTLTIIRATSITGTITTENHEGKYNSTVTVYRSDDVAEPRTVIEQTNTNEDGSFEIILATEEFEDTDGNGVPDVLETNYDVVVTKDGYLTYTVKNIELTKGKNADIGTYHLIAGDVAESGEIEISDLVYMNDNIYKAKDMKCDLNEDGIINSTDRNILESNYGKLAVTEEWQKPIQVIVDDQQSMNNNLVGVLKTNDGSKLILPLKTDYRITSEYGERVHPVTGELKKHTGIDIQGEWHTEIISIADGEVVDCGVSNAWGNYVEIKHTENGVSIYSFYAHLSQIDVSIGQQVKQGDTIGLEGGAESDPNHGYSTGHHLHFEIRNQKGYGNDVDPTQYIKF